VLTDTSDNKFLELAAASSADFLITGNTLDFTLDEFEVVPKFLRIVIQTFRISVGDIKVNKYGDWGVDRPDDKEFKSA
jgi:predicted nucleic acid-binding protein